MKHFYPVLFTASLAVLALLFWAMSDICTWLIVDSHALVEFPKIHPFLARVAMCVWFADSFGGRYLMIGGLVLVWWLAFRPMNGGRRVA